MSKGNYILDENHQPVQVADVLVWGKWFEETDRTVAKTNCGEVKVSTVFLGMDHQFGEGPPLLFETMVFGGSMDEHQERYTTWDKAVAGHEKMVAAVRAAEASNGPTD